jgi:hypothetical protein
MAIANRYDLFLSHNRRHKAWVRDLVAFFRGSGLRVFFDEDGIVPGEDVLGALERALESSRYIILIVSRSSMLSRWVSFETALSVYSDPDSRDRRVIPVLVERIEFSEIRPSIRRLDIVDLTEPETREREFAILLQSIGVPADRATMLKSWPQPIGIEDLFIADINGVLAKNWGGPELLDELISIDYAVIDNLTSVNEGKTNQWAPVFMDHPDTWRLLTNSSRDILGYWHFVPLFADEYQKAKKGLLVDGEITTDCVRLFELPGIYDIYFVSFCLLPKYRRSRAILMLVLSFAEIIFQLAKEGVFIREVCANAYTGSGEALCKSFGMSLIGLHADHGKMFVAEMPKILEHEAFRGYDELKELYRSRLPRAQDVISS